MTNVVVGIDIGKKGAIACLSSDSVIFLSAMPTKKVVVNHKQKEDYDIGSIVQIIDNIQRQYNISALLCEFITAMPNQYSQTAFSLGYGVGIFEGLAASKSIPFYKVVPRVWQKEFFGKAKVEDTKEESIKYVHKLYPEISLRATKRCTSDHDGMADSLLISRYGVIHYLSY